MIRSCSPVAMSQSLAVWSCDPVRTVLPSALTAAATTQPLWPLRTRSSSPVEASQRRAVLSLEPVSNLPPSGAKATESTTPEWPLSVSRCLPVVTFHSFAVPFQCPVSANVPQGLNAIDLASPASPLKVRTLSPKARSFTASSLAAEPRAPVTPKAATASARSARLGQRHASMPPDYMAPESAGLPILHTEGWNGGAPACAKMA
mmetsp:Transcript_47674/g.149852  ORF Transcript_47674/g.149852 Transcript_47674/m.149852 type:complete len:204 (-) Transcript_47674:3-614(-)